jgi:hypothetical protein
VWLVGHEPVEYLGPQLFEQSVSPLVRGESERPCCPAARVVQAMTYPVANRSDGRILDDVRDIVSFGPDKPRRPPPRRVIVVGVIALPAAVLAVATVVIVGDHRGPGRVTAPVASQTVPVPDAAGAPCLPVGWAQSVDEQAGQSIRHRGASIEGRAVTGRGPGRGRGAAPTEWLTRQTRGRGDVPGQRADSRA